MTLAAPRPPHHDSRTRRESRAHRARKLLQPRARPDVGRRHPARARRSAPSGAPQRARTATATKPVDPRFRGDPDHPFDEPSADDRPRRRPEELGPKLYTRRADLRGRTPAQREYLKQIISHDVTFGIGPAGTGKTYLAVACAVDALERDQVKRIVLTRPAVEAGERLGFLPGDLAQKVDPYLRPLYDALYDLLGFDKTAKMFERQMIEIAPLAYMRGRTLNHAFIILDEAQNTTPEQMKMFLTRIGFGSKAVVTGDTTQVDLPRGHKSGLIEAQHVLSEVRGIALTHFTSARTWCGIRWSRASSRLTTRSRRKDAGARRERREGRRARPQCSAHAHEPHEPRPETDADDAVPRREGVSGAQGAAAARDRRRAGSRPRCSRTRELTVRFVDADEGRTLNRTYRRRITRPTC